MSTQPVSIEVLRRVYDDHEGVFIEVGPGADGFGVHIGTDDKSAVWFGKLDLTMTAEIAEALGHALIACAKEQVNT